MEFPKVGDVFEGRYELRSVLGKGGFATVFLATDREMSRDVVIKALTPVDGGYPKTVVARFAREAKIFTRLQDPHNVTVYHVGESATGVLYMVFEYVEGQELGFLLKQRGALEPWVVAHILTQLLQALREAHELGILHRDIKPANVLIHEYDGDPYRVKLLDFGIAKELRPDAQKITRTGHVVGTPRYMAPEQLVGDRVSQAGDLYSLGLVGYELLCGEPAIAGREQRDILRNQLSREPLHVPVDRAPPALRGVLERLMEREREARYQSAGDALRDLIGIRDDVLRWSGRASAPVSAPSSTANAARKPSMAWVVAVCAGAVVLGVAAGLFLLQPEPEPPPPRAVALRVAAPVTSAPDPTPEPVDVGAPPAEAPRDGCGQTPPFYGLGEMAESTFGERWATYIPTDYDPQRRYPIVLLFHRKLRNGAMIITQTRMDEVAEKHGAILIAPTSTGALAWSVEDGVSSVQRAVAHAAQHLCVDPTRRYALGDNTGATFLRLLMTGYPISAAAFAFNGIARTVEPVAATPRLRLFGHRDRNVPEQGGIGCNLLDGEQSSAAAIEKNWKHLYGCRGRAEDWGDFGGGKCWVYRRCDIAPLVTCATDGGHQWPGTPPMLDAESCKYDDPEVPFPHAEAAWQFFEEFGISVEAEDIGVASSADAGPDRAGADP